LKTEFKDAIYIMEIASNTISDTLRIRVISYDLYTVQEHQRAGIVARMKDKDVICLQRVPYDDIFTWARDINLVLTGYEMTQLNDIWAPYQCITQEYKNRQQNNAVSDDSLNIVSSGSRCLIIYDARKFGVQMMSNNKSFGVMLQLYHLYTKINGSHLTFIICNIALKSDIHDKYRLRDYSKTRLRQFQSCMKQCAVNIIGIPVCICGRITSLDLDRMDSTGRPMSDIRILCNEAALIVDRVLSRDVSVFYNNIWGPLTDGPFDDFDLIFE